MLTVSIAALPGATVAASPLALKQSDYPARAKLAVVPATNEAADHYLAPAHNSTFEHLKRLDGAGWLQFATWSFKTGDGNPSVRHQTIFGYGINLFRRSKDARRALGDVKLPSRPIRVAHLAARHFVSSSADRTLVFTFLTYRRVEVEAYYEYAGVAPSSIARSLRHIFSRQLSHLVHLVRTIGQAIPTATSVPATSIPTNTSTPLPTATPTATVVPSPSSSPAPTLSPTVTRTPTSTPTATPTSSPVPTATLTPIVVQASMSSPSYPPGAPATVNVSVQRSDQPVTGVLVHASFAFDAGARACDSRTDTNGMASCSVVVPTEAPGTLVRVTVQVVDSEGQSAYASTSFTVGTH